MPDGEFKIPTLSLKEFENALNIYLDKLQDELEAAAEKESGEGIWQRIWGGWNPFAKTQAERVDEYINDLYNQYMDIAETEGVGEWIPGYEDILTVGAPNLLNYKQDEYYRQKYEQALEDALNQASKNESIAESQRQFDITQAQREKEFEYTKEQNRLDRAISQSRWAQERADQLNAQRRSEIGDWSSKLLADISQQPRTSWSGFEDAQKMAGIYEQVRSEILGELDPVRDWITYQEVKNKPNRWTQTQLPSQEEQLKDVQNQKKFIQYELKKLQGQIKDEDSPLYRSDQVRWVENALKHQLDQMEAQEMSIQTGQFEGASDWINKLAATRPGLNYANAAKLASGYTPFAPGNKGYYTPEQENILMGMLTAASQSQPAGPKEIEMPSWLRPLVVGQPKTVNRNQQVLTPSGQVWNRLAPSQREMYRGLVEYTGGSPEDFEWSMYSQTPKALRLGKTWKSFTQG